MSRHSPRCATDGGLVRGGDLDGGERLRGLVVVVGEQPRHVRAVVLRRRARDFDVVDPQRHLVIDVRQLDASRAAVILQLERLADHALAGLVAIDEAGVAGGDDGDELIVPSPPRVIFARSGPSPAARL